MKDNRGLTYYIARKVKKSPRLHEINGDLYYFRQGGAYKYTQLGDMWQDSIITLMVKSTTSVMTVKTIKNRFYQWGNDWYYFYADGTAATECRSN